MKLLNSTTETSVSFEEPEHRREAMQRTIERWLAELGSLVDEASASEAFTAWLNVQSRFTTYSARNALLIAQQHPEATRVAGYRTWRDEFDRFVKQGERAIWIWAPIIAKRCPTCQNSRRYHERTGCEDDEMPPEDWPRGLVGFKPVSVFDISQTEGEPLPAFETAAFGEGSELVARLLDAAAQLGIEARVVEAEEWAHGEARGVCVPAAQQARQAVVEVKARPNDADLARTLIHEYAHARLHLDIDEADERAKREVEAEAVAYVVGRHFGLDTANSAFYLAAWQSEDSSVIQDRLERISTTVETVIGVIDGSSAHA